MRSRPPLLLVRPQWRYSQVWACAAVRGNIGGIRERVRVTLPRVKFEGQTQGMLARWQGSWELGRISHEARDTSQTDGKGRALRGIESILSFSRLC